MGGMGPNVLDRVLSHADGWFPGHTDTTFDGLGDRIVELRERAASIGKSVKVTINFARLECVEDYVALAPDRVVYKMPAGVAPAETRQFLQDVVRVAEQVADETPGGSAR
jgi:hypothetical protein